VTPLTSLPLAIAFLVFCASLIRALAVQARFAAPLCGQCGYTLERKSLGEPVCRCRVG